MPGRRSRFVLVSQIVDEWYEERVDGEAGRGAGARVVFGLQDLDGRLRDLAQVAQQAGDTGDRFGEASEGAALTDSDIDALPLHRHRFHGDWNYTLHPQPRDTTSAATTSRPADAPSPQPCTGCLRNPELTGMPEPALDELTGQLDQKLDELREQGRLRRRGGERTRARGAGAKDKLTTADRVLATVLYLRKLSTRDLLA